MLFGLFSPGSSSNTPSHPFGFRSALLYKQIQVAQIPCSAGPSKVVDGEHIPQLSSGRPRGTFFQRYLRVILLTVVGLFACAGSL